MGHRPILITGLWAIHINKEEIISPLFICMGHRPVITTVLWAIQINK